MATLVINAANETVVGPSSLNQGVVPSTGTDLGATVEAQDATFAIGTSSFAGAVPSVLGCYFPDDGTIPPAATINSVTLSVRHRIGGAGAGTDILAVHAAGTTYSPVYFDGHGIIDSSLDNTSYETWNVVLTTYPPTGVAWTRAQVFDYGVGNTGQFSLVAQESLPVDITHEIDHVFITVDYTGGDDITGWYDSTGTGLRSGDDAELITNPAPITTLPRGPRGMLLEAPFTEDNPFWGYPGHAVTLGNKLYYAAGDYEVGTDLPTIRVWDGHTDTEVCKIPVRGGSGGGTPPIAVTCMAAYTDRYILIGVWNTGTTSTTMSGTLLRLRVTDGSLVTLGISDSIGLGHIPSCIFAKGSLIIVGTHRGDSPTAGGSIWKSNFDTVSLVPGSPSWVQLVTPAQLQAANQGSIVSMAQPILAQADNGGIVFGTTAPAGTFAVVGYLNYFSGATSTVLTGSGGAAQNWNGFYAVSPFMAATDNIPGGVIRMIAAYWNPDAAPVSKIICNNAGSSTVYTDATGTQIMNIVVDGKIFDVGEPGVTLTTGTTYAFGARKESGVYTGLAIFNKDPEDLTQWTNVTALLPLSNDDITLSSRAPTNAFGVITL